MQTTRSEKLDLRLTPEAKRIRQLPVSDARGVSRPRGPQVGRLDHAGIFTVGYLYITATA
jgi:hypothetical protein